MIPEYFTSHNQWCVFKIYADKKMPVTYKGDPAKSNDPKTWGTFEQVKKAVEFGIGHAIAYCITKKDRLLFIDIDDPTHPDAQKYLSLPTYTEKSQSGKGYHVIGWFGGEAPKNDGIEFYTDGRWCILTGDVVDNKCDINDINDSFKPLPQKSAEPLKIKESYKVPEKIRDGERNTQLHKMACSLAAKGHSDSAVFVAVLEENRTRCNPPLPEDEVRTLVSSACQFNKKNPLPEVKPEIKEVQKPVVDENHVKKAEEIMRSGSPLDTLLNGFRYNHRGHEETARSVIYAGCLQSSQTTKGLQPSISGEKGGGKSHSVRSTLHLMPPEYIWDSSLSTKALYYNKPPEKCIIYIDEKLPDEVVDVLKRVMTNFQIETTHKTVLERKGAELHIPKRLVFINTSVWEGGDDQLRDRTLSVGILNESADYSSYYEFELARRMEGRPEFMVNEDILICRQIMRHIKEREFIVRIPKIDFAYKHDTRLMNQVFDLMEASAILNYMQREHEKKDGVIYVTATEADLQSALNFSMFTIADKKSEGRLSRAERALDESLQKHLQSKKKEEDEFTESEIAGIYGKSQQAIRRLIYGPDGNQQKWSGGLLEKCPWYKMDKSYREALHGTNIIKVQRHSYDVQRCSFSWVLNESS